jgi:hypothetical protein
MKKSTVLVLILSISIHFLNAQNSFPMPSGNVGIGTNNPDAKLDVYTDLPIPAIYNSQNWTTRNSGYNLKLQTVWSNDNGINQQFVQRFNGIDYTSLSFFAGNVGIGTATPSSKLDVNLASINDRFQVQQAGNVRFYASGEGVVKWGRSADFGCLTWDTDLAIVGGQSMKALSLRANGIDQVRITTAGNVGIGTTTPDAKLAVNGTIHAREVKVDLAGWPDYVFEKYYTGASKLKSSYILPTLAEVEQFTKENHHLPNVPSAKEVKENGLQLGEISNIMLQKIEELTLYVIEQQKKLDEQNKALKIQNNTLQNQQKELETLAKRLTHLDKK